MQVSWDEDDIIYAGYTTSKHGDFGLNPEHPPLVKLLASSRHCGRLRAGRETYGSFQSF